MEENVHITEDCELAKWTFVKTWTLQEHHATYFYSFYQMCLYCNCSCDNILFNASGKPASIWFNEKCNYILPAMEPIYKQEYLCSYGGFRAKIGQLSFHHCVHWP